MKTKHFSKNLNWLSKFFAIGAIALLTWNCSEKVSNDQSKRDFTTRPPLSGYLDSIEFTDGRMVFSSLDEFDGLLNDLLNMNDSTLKVKTISLPSFTSFRESLEFDDDLIPQKDIILGTILNSDKIFQVSKWVIKIDGDSIFAVDDEHFNEDPEACWNSEGVIRVGPDQSIWTATGLEEDDCSDSNRSDQNISNNYYLITSTAHNNSTYEYGFRLELKYNNSWLGLYHKYSVKGQFGMKLNGNFQPLTGSYTDYLPKTSFSTKLDIYYATLDPRCKSCITKQKSNETFNYNFDETLYSSTRGLQYHKAKQSCKLTIGSNTQTTSLLTMQSWVPGSCDCPSW